MTVITVTPNPALDVTYVVDELRPGAAHRVAEVLTRPGGKGLNVARVLAALSVPVVATGLAGGATGDELRARLADRACAVGDALVTVDVPTRRTVTVVDRRAGTATLMNEPGNAIGPAGWETLLERVRELAGRADVLVCSGSLPPGVPAGGLGDVVRLARAACVPAIVDTSGPGLVEAVAAGAAVVKPNAEELHEVTGVRDPLAAATALRGDAEGAVVASLGADGLLAVTGRGAWRARLPRPVSGNPTGAGDSVVAALALGRYRGSTWPEVLRSACALSAATVQAAAAGEFDAESYAGLLPDVEICEVDR